MAVATFAAPLLPGRTEHWKQAVAEIHGSRKESYEEFRRLLAVTREVGSLQATPTGDMVVVFLEAEDPDSVLARTMASAPPFGRWFTETVLIGAHGMEPGAGPPPANPVMLDYHA